jgi:hypothetical protein
MLLWSPWLFSLDEWDVQNAATALRMSVGIQTATAWSPEPATMPG